MPNLILPQRFSASFVSRVFFNRDYRNKTLNWINTGRCYDWAYYAYCLWGNVKLWTSDIHAWVQVGGKFYDSESFTGKARHEDLNCNAAFDWEDEPPRQVTSEEFQNIWDTHGGGRRRHWHALRDDIVGHGLIVLRQ